MIDWLISRPLSHNALISLYYYKDMFFLIVCCKFVVHSLFNCLLWLIINKLRFLQNQ